MLIKFKKRKKHEKIGKWHKKLKKMVKCRQTSNETQKANSFKH